MEIVRAPHPAIATCAVIGVPDEKEGERVHAVVVPVAGQAVTLEEPREFCAERVAATRGRGSMEFVEGPPLSTAG